MNLPALNKYSTKSFSFVPKGINRGRWVFIFPKGSAKNSIMVLYTPKTTQRTPPEIPGRTAPKPTRAP